MYLVEKFEAPNLTDLKSIHERVLQQGAHVQMDSFEPPEFSTYTRPEANERVSKMLLEIGLKRKRCTVLRTRTAECDGVVPDDFYATSNHPTFVYMDGEWVRVKNLRMDACVVIRDNGAFCTLMRDVRAGERVVVGDGGTRTAVFGLPGSDEGGFAFMKSEVSSERQIQSLIKELALHMREIRKREGRIVFVAGPAIVHTGAVAPFCDLIQKGYVNAVLAGNALAVHDIENALYKTSLGVYTDTGIGAIGGHRNHLAAINRVRFHKSVENAVRSGEVGSGIMRALVLGGIPYALAGSIRDDGPLPDTDVDMLVAQRKYAELLRDADMVLMMGSMLHSIGAANMTPRECKMVCVDINPAVIAKLVDRGSSGVEGIVTDVRLFLEALNRELA